MSVLCDGQLAWQWSRSDSVVGPVLRSDPPPSTHPSWCQALIPMSRSQCWDDPWLTAWWILDRFGGEGVEGEVCRLLHTSRLNANRRHSCDPSGRRADKSTAPDWHHPVFLNLWVASQKWLVEPFWWGRSFKSSFPNGNLKYIFSLSKCWAFLLRNTQFNKITSIIYVPVLIFLYNKL